MTVQFPLALALLPLIALLVWLSRPRDDQGLRRWPSGLIRTMLILRSAGLACLVLALAGVALSLPGDRQDLVLLIDVSDSQGPALVETARTAALKTLAAQRDVDRASVVIFAGSARVLAGPGQPSLVARDLAAATLVLPDAGQTDLRAAFNLAASLRGAAAGNPVWYLYGDGWPTRGGSLAALTEGSLPAAINAIPLGRPAGRLVSLGLEPPSRLRAGDEARLRWRVVAPAAVSVTVRIRVDGVAAGSRVCSLAPGFNQVEVPVAVPDSGTHRVDLELPAGVDGQVQAQAAAYLDVAGAPRVLLIHGAEADSPLGAVLRAQGMALAEAGSEGLPEDPAAYDAVSLLVLDNLPATFLRAAQLSALQAYVAGGGGLLVVGGDASLGRGDYWASPLEEILPVRTDSRQRLFFNRSKILFVIDHSGSMSDQAGGVTKLAAAMQGVGLAVDGLAEQDEVAVLSFDSEATWQLGFTPVKDRRRIDAALASLPTGGGTDMAKAMAEVVAGFGEPGPTRRHVIFLTDGQTGDAREQFRYLAEQLVAVGVTITTIGIGDDVNQELLAELAAWGNGVYYRAEADQVPRLIKRDTVQVTRDLIQEGSFQPVAITTGGLSSSLPPELPPVSGYLLTRAKPQATVWFGLPGKSGPAGSDAPTDPLLVSWHYGAGQAAVFTSDSGRRWLPAWSSRAVLNRFWTGLVRGLEASQRDQGLHLSVQTEAAATRISVEAIGPGRRLQAGLQLVGETEGMNFRLDETAPGHYEASVPLATDGLRRFRVSDSLGGGWASAWTWSPVQGEGAHGGTDLAGLGRLAAGSGGKLLPAEDPIVAERPLSWSPVGMGAWLVLAAALLLLVELGLRSTMLGQLAMARALFGEWLRRQRQLAARAADPLALAHADTTDGGHDRVMDAYRYLAVQAQQRAARQAVRAAGAGPAPAAAGPETPSGNAGPDGG